MNRAWGDESVNECMCEAWRSNPPVSTQMQGECGSPPVIPASSRSKWDTLSQEVDGEWLRTPTVNRWPPNACAWTHTHTHTHTKMNEHFTVAGDTIQKESHTHCLQSKTGISSGFHIDSRDLPPPCFSKALNSPKSLSVSLLTFPWGRWFPKTETIGTFSPEFLKATKNSRAEWEMSGFPSLATIAWSATFSLPILPRRDSIYRGLRMQGWSEAKEFLQVWSHGHFSRLQLSELRSKMPLDSGWIPSELLESHPERCGAVFLGSNPLRLRARVVCYIWGNTHQSLPNPLWHLPTKPTEGAFHQPHPCL